jgi:hypothetical protein
VSQHHSRVSHYLRGGDPAPTDTHELRTVVGILQTVTDQVTDAAAVLRSIGHDTELWTGDGARAFKTTVGDLQTRLNSAQTAYTESVDALRGWLRKLEPLQTDAMSVARQADSVGPRAGEPSPLPFLPVPDELAPLQARHDSIAHAAAHAAAACARALAEAIHVVRQYEHSAWDGIADYLTELKHNITHVVEWVSMAALVLAVIPGCQPAAAFLALTAAGLAAAAELVSLTLVVGGKETWGEFGQDTFWNAITIAGPGARAIGVAAHAAGGLHAGAQAAAGAAVGAAYLAREVRAGSSVGRVLTGFALHEADDAGRLAKEAAAVEKGISPRGFADGSLHPGRTIELEEKFGELGKSTEHLHGLDAWLPPGHQIATGTDILVESLDAGHTGVGMGEQIVESTAGETGDRAHERVDLPAGGAHD